MVKYIDNDDDNNNKQILQTTNELERKIGAPNSLSLFLFLLGSLFIVVVVVNGRIIGRVK